MGNYSSNLLTAVKRPSERLTVLIELTLPSGTVLRWAVHPTRVSGVGTYLGKLLSVGSFYHSCGSIDGSIIYPTMDNVVVEDVDGSLGRELELQKPDGAMINARIAARGVTNPADWLYVFGNGVLDDWSKNSIGQWTLVSSFDESPLRSPFPRTLLNAADFPYVADPTLYTYSPYVGYGTHSSINAGDRGMVQLYYINTQAGDFGAFLGWVAIPRVFKNDVLQTLTTHYTVRHDIINGRLYTIVRFVTPPAATDRVYVDVEGYRAGIDGTGDLLTGANALAHLYNNWVFPATDWASGAWNGTHARVSATHFAEMQTWLELVQWQKVSRVYGGQNRVTGTDAMKDFAESMGRIGGCRPMFTLDGKLGIRPNYWNSTTLAYTDLRALRYEQELGEQGVGSFRLQRDRQYLADRLDVKSILATGYSEFKWALQVHEPSIDRNRADVLELTWSHAQVE